MTIELDPDLQLFARLALGRGLQRIALVAGFTVAFVLTAAGALSGTMVTLPARMSSGAALPLAFALIVFGAARGVVRLFELEREGLLDQIRMCGRPPARTLAACLLASTTPYLALAAALIVAQTRARPDPLLWTSALIVLCAAFTVALGAYGALPGAVVPDARFMTPLLLLAAGTMAAVARTPQLSGGWLRSGAALSGVAFLVLALPVSVWLARRRLRRPGAGPPRLAASIRGIAWLVPASGPPELFRQLRVAMRSTGTLAALVVAPATVLAVSAITMSSAALKEVALQGIPVFVMFGGYAAIALTVRGEVTSGAIDLVRLSPQRAMTVALGWYFGLAIPLWTTTALALVALSAVYATIQWNVWLFVLAAALPAIAIAESLQRRRPGTYLVVAVALFLLMRGYATAQNENVIWAAEIEQEQQARDLFRNADALRAQLPADWRLSRTPPYRDLYDRFVRELMAAYSESDARLRARVRAIPGNYLRTGIPLRMKIPVSSARRWPFSVPLTAVVIAGALAFGAAAGRLRRADGPAFTGVALVGALALAALVVRTLPVIAFPRLFPVLMLALAPFAAVERAIPSSRWSRVGMAAAAAAIVALVAALQGGVEWMWSIDTAAASALALAAGILVHEWSVRTPALSLLLRTILIAALIPLWALPLRGGQSAQPGLAGLLTTLSDMIAFGTPLVPLVPPATRVWELVALAALLAVAAMLHARAQRTA